MEIRMITKTQADIDARQKMKLIIGNNLKEQRLKFNYSMEEVARMLGISYSTYWHWETGTVTHMISIFDLLRASKIYKVKMNKLLEGIDRILKSN